MNKLFHRFSSKAANLMGSPYAFVISLGIIAFWATSGPAFGYSDTWQLMINTGTTIVTFLMVFLIQNTQNRDARAIHLKLDELVRSGKGARLGMINIEGLDDKELDQLQEEFKAIHDKYFSRLNKKKETQQ